MGRVYLAALVTLYAIQLGRFPLAALLGAICGGCALVVPERREEVAQALEIRTGFRTGNGAGLPAGIQLERGLVEADAVALALWTSPAFQAALAELDLARADVERAGLLTNPVLSVLFPWGAKQLEFFAKLPVEALWLRHKRVEAAHRDYERVATLLVRDGLNLVRDVRVTWTRLGAARRSAEVLRGVAENRGRVVELVEARIAGGDAAAAEANPPRAVAQLARIQFERAERACAPIEERLVEWMRLPRTSGATVFHTDIQRPCPRWSDAGALATEARAYRPELRAVELAVEAAGERVGLHRADVARLTAVLDANRVEGGGIEAGPGLDLEIPIFGRRAGPDQARAQAELERASWELIQTERQVEREVREAVLAYERSESALAALRTDVLPVLQEALRVAERIEAVGETSYLEALDAEALLLAGQRTEIEYETELQLARIELERSVGRNLD